MFDLSVGIITGNSAYTELPKLKKQEPTMKASGFTKEYACSVYNGKNIIDFENVFLLMKKHLILAGFNVEDVIETDPVFGGNKRVLYVGPKWRSLLQIDTPKYAFVLKGKDQANNYPSSGWDITVLSYYGVTLVDSLNGLQDPASSQLPRGGSGWALAQSEFVSASYRYYNADWDQVNVEKVKITFYANGHTGVIWMWEEIWIPEYPTLAMYYETKQLIVLTSIQRVISDMEKNNVSRLFYACIGSQSIIHWFVSNNSGLFITSYCVSCELSSQAATNGNCSKLNLPNQLTEKQFLPIIPKLQSSPSAGAILGKVENIYFPVGSFSYREEVLGHILTATSKAPNEYHSLDYAGRGLAVPIPANGFILET